MSEKDSGDSQMNISNSSDSTGLEDEKLLSKLNLEDGSAANNTSITLDGSLLSYNVPEKIIIVLDRACDENSTHFQVSPGKKYSPLFMLQHALKIFLHNKSQINPEHQFAIIQLNECTATWVHDFTNSVQDILASVRSITDVACEPEDIFDLNKVFDIINEKLEPFNLDTSNTTPPSYVIRTILLYGRSYSLPKLEHTTEVGKLLNSPYFTVDIVMTHEPPDSGNHCEQIFKYLQEIDIKGSSYIFSVSRNASELHCALAKILSHPLQRPHLVNANYNLKLLNVK